MTETMGTHYGSCYRVHHQCAIAMIERVPGAGDFRDTMLTFTEALRIESSAPGASAGLMGVVEAQARRTWEAAHCGNARLRDALRKHAIIHDFDCLGDTPEHVGWECLECKGSWGINQPEEHKDGCLATLKDGSVEAVDWTPYDAEIKRLAETETYDEYEGRETFVPHQLECAKREGYLAASHGDARLRDALAELVYLKDVIHDTPEYHQRKDAAWQEARTRLKDGA